MKIAYLILAHNNPRHLERMIAALRCDNSRFFVHIDGKSDIANFEDSINDDVVFCEKRSKVYWGEFSIVQATLDLMACAKTYDKCTFNYFVLLSGSDFPIRSNDYISNFFSANIGKIYLNSTLMPNESAGKPISRLTKYRFQSEPSLKKSFVLLVAKLFHLRLDQRNYEKVFGTLKPYAGSQWWALPEEAVDYVHRFIRQNGKVIDFFKNTHCPDEMLFQTILSNSPLKEKIVGNLTYTDWSGGGHSPATVSAKHIERFNSSELNLDDGGFFRPRERLFARKFDNTNEALVSSLKRHP